MCHFRRTPGNGASDGRVEQPMYLQFRYFATKILWPKIRRIRQHGFTFLYIMIFNLSFPTVAALYPQLSNGRVSDPNPIISEVLSCFLSRPRLYLRRTELIKSEPVPSTYQSNIGLDPGSVWICPGSTVPVLEDSTGLYYSTGIYSARNTADQSTAQWLHRWL